MQKKTRRILRATAVGLFCLLAPAIVLYAIGYRYNLRERMIQRVGVISLYSHPKDVQIHINGTMVANTAPFSIQNLLPDTYRVRIEKEGYTPWEKSLDVTSMRVTYAGDIVLFKPNGGETVLGEGKFIMASASPSGKDGVALRQEDNGQKTPLWIRDGRVWRIKIPSDVQTTLDGLQQVEAVSWFTDKSRVLIRGTKNTGMQTGIILKEFGDSEQIDIEQVRLPGRTEPSTAIMFDPRRNRTFLFQQGEMVGRYDADAGTVEIAYTQIRSFAFQGNRLVLVKNDGTLIRERGNFLAVYPAETDALVHLPKTLTAAPDFHLLHQEDHDAAEDQIFFLANNTLHLFVVSDGTLTAIGPAGGPLRQDMKGRTTFAAGPEARILSFSSFGDEATAAQTEMSREKESIKPLFRKVPVALARFSEDVKEVAWYPDATHVGIRLANRIVLAETDGRDRRNTADISIPRGSAPAFLLFDTKGRSLVTLTDRGIVRKEITE